MTLRWALGWKAADEPSRTWCNIKIPPMPAIQNEPAACAPVKYKVSSMALMLASEGIALSLIGSIMAHRHAAASAELRSSESIATTIVS